MGKDTEAGTGGDPGEKKRARMAESTLTARCGSGAQGRRGSGFKTTPVTKGLLSA